jgi:hypothetical protein
MKTFKLIFASFLFFIPAIILSDQVLYKLWLVPQLSSSQHIPSYYFLIIFLPLLLVVLFFGLTVTRLKQISLVGLVFTLCHQLYDYLSVVQGSPGYLSSYAPEQTYDFWIIRSLIIICIYVIVLSILWYTKDVILRTVNHIRVRYQLKNRKVEPAVSNINNEDRMPARIIYHVVPFGNKWLVKKGKAKKASSAHSTKEDALRAASEVAKSHPQSQVVVHNASGVIESDRTFEYRHYKKKRKKKEISRKIKKGLKRNKRKELERRLLRRRAARLGIARAKRRQYLRRRAAKNGARKRKK